MKLIIILVALALERGVHFGRFLKRFSFFDPYVKLLRRSLGKTFLWRGYVGVATVLIPVLLIIGLIYYLLGHFLYGLAGAIIACVVLLYCLGPDDLYARIGQYFSSAEEETTEKESSEKTNEHLANLLEMESSANSNANRELTKTILWQFNIRIFAVIFWFVVLGPLGALLYRMTTLLAKMPTPEEGSPDTALILSADRVQSILDWIPARLLGFGYALVGDFSKTFTYWLQNVYSAPTANQTFVNKSGLMALHLTEEESAAADIQENKAVLALVDRALIVYLVVIASFVLGAWIY